MGSCHPFFLWSQEPCQAGCWCPFLLCRCGGGRCAGPFVAQCCQSWSVAQLSRNLTAVPKIPGSNPGIVKFLVCHPLGMPNLGERLGFHLVHKKCSPQTYKRGGGGVWVGPKLGGCCPNYPPLLQNDAWAEGQGVKRRKTDAASGSDSAPSDPDSEVDTTGVLSDVSGPSSDSSSSSDSSGSSSSSEENDFGESSSGESNSD